MLLRRTLPIDLLLALALCVTARPAAAAWPHDPNGNVPLCTAANHQNHATIISDGAGGAIVTWHDGRSGNYDIYAQRISASGTPLWTANGVALCTAASDQYSPTITSDGAGGAIVTWEDLRSGINYDIYAQRISPTGTPLWTANGVALSTAASAQREPALTSDGAGGAIVTWYDSRNGINNDIYAQRISSAGTPLWTADGVALSTATGHQQAPTITSDGAGGAIITWEDFRISISSNDIYAQRITAAGTPLWTTNGVALCTAANSQLLPTITSDGAGGAIVTWHDSRSVSSNDIYAQRISPAGTTLWTADGVALCTAAGHQQATTITSDGAGGAIITWEDLRSGSTSDMYAQRISPAGTTLWTPNGVALCTALGEQAYATITSDGAGGAIVTWHDYRIGSAFDIYAQRIGASGTPVWTANGVALSTTAGNQQYPAITSDGAGGAIVTWHDGRSGSTYDIYAQRIDTFGYLGAEPVIANVRDIPFDQGGQVKVSWQGSHIDALSDPNLAYYDVLRSVPSTIAMSRIRNGGALATSLAGLKSDGGLVALPMRGQAYYWERLTSIAALHYITNYSYIAPTLQDSVNANNPKTAFMIVGRNAAGSMYWLSQPDSGYSVDNLPPYTPAPFTGQYSAGLAKLHWNRNTEADLAGYRLYRGSSPSFTPGASNLVAALSDTGYTDAASTPCVYKLTAIDSHGNESPVATLLPSGTLGVDDGPATRLSLAAPSPNPAHGSTTIAFTLPHDGHVRLSVYDAAGRRVQTIHDAPLTAGAYHQAFALHDDEGHDLPSGLYLVRLEAEGRILTRRIAALR